VLYQRPERLDAVELGAVGRQKLKRDAVLLQQFERWLDHPLTLIDAMSITTTKRLVTVLAISITAWDA